MPDDKPQRTWATRHSLIQRIQDPEDPEAWDDFVRHYCPFIHFLLNKMNIRAADQDDMVQEILIRLHKSVATYIREKAKFHTWLGTITRNTALNYLNKEYRLIEKNTEIAESLQRLESHTQSDFDRVTESEWKQYITGHALNLLKSTFSENVIECFRMTLEGKNAQQIADALGIKKETVYIIRTRMKTRVILKMKEIIEELNF